jgi:hypothetical protein
MEYIIVVVENMLTLYQFRPNTGKQAGRVLFVIEGFKNWKKKENLQSCGQTDERKLVNNGSKTTDSNEMRERKERQQR